MHALRGTKPRHGPKPPTLATVPAVRSDPLPTTVREGLGARGVALAAAIWSEYDGWRGSVSTSRTPRPRPGWAGSHGTGVRLGCEPGAGKGNTRERAAWWAM